MCHPDPFGTKMNHWREAFFFSPNPFWVFPEQTVINHSNRVRWDIAVLLVRQAVTRFRKESRWLSMATPHSSRLRGL
jgi:hypothetical protein